MSAAGKKQAEDEVPDEAVTFAASDPGGPERDRDPDDRDQDPPEDGHGHLVQHPHTTLILLPDSSTSTRILAREQRPDRAIGPDMGQGQWS